MAHKSLSEFRFFFFVKIVCWLSSFERRFACVANRDQNAIFEDLKAIIILAEFYQSYRGIGEWSRQSRTWIANQSQSVAFCKCTGCHCGFLSLISLFQMQIVNNFAVTYRYCRRDEDRLKPVLESYRYSANEPRVIVYDKCVHSRKNEKKYPHERKVERRKKKRNGEKKSTRNNNDKWNIKAFRFILKCCKFHSVCCIKCTQNKNPSKIMLDT